LAVLSHPSNKDTRRLKRLFDQVLPELLRKPARKWTRDELRDAIELHLKRPFGGMINFERYVALEAKIKSNAQRQALHDLVGSIVVGPPMFPIKQLTAAALFDLALDRLAHHDKTMAEHCVVLRASLHDWSL
jgi:poly-gamma-glutamate capsule biosynthesis protein CapA/YwtB (metallophosphatase superfamily)